ncbi:MAG TPA: RusA family crossover junction endodeoxyribonuclease [Alphaproteobacteria bacterium]|nr:RusA family crossover junction endodeoxyribonuclease [Alphaproteobacteria bacterium]
MGSARLRATLLDDAFLMQAAGTSTSSRGLRQNLAPLFRGPLKGRGPDYRTYAVQIWIEGLGRNDRIDVDNIGKACLDALTGLVWRDDRQVVRLSIEKLATETPRITLAAEPAEVRSGSQDLAGWLRRADEPNAGRS